MSKSLNICPDCGAAFAPVDGATHKYMGGSPECWAMFNDVLAREFQDPAYGIVHRLTVDAYATQHPGDQSDRRAVQSVNIHLTALYLLIDQGHGANHVRTALKTLASNFKSAFEPLTPPQKYDLTIKDVAAAATPEDHCRIVRDWAACVWRSWDAHHDVARALAQRIET